MCHFSWLLRFKFKGWLNLENVPFLYKARKQSFKVWIKFQFYRIFGVGLYIRNCIDFCCSIVREEKSTILMENCPNEKFWWWWWQWWWWYVFFWGGGLSKMRHIKITKFQLFIPFNIFSLYICLLVQISFYFTLLFFGIENVRSIETSVEKTQWLGHCTIFSFTSPMLDNRQSLRHRKSSG